MLILPSILTLVLFTILTVRLLYLRYIRACWEETCAVYIVRTGGTPQQLTQYAAMWPMWQMVLYAHVWRAFQTFVVDQASMTTILGYFRNPAPAPVSTPES